MESGALKRSAVLLPLSGVAVLSVCGREGGGALREVSKKDYSVVLGKPLFKPHCILTLWPSCTGLTDGVRRGNFCCLGKRIVMVN